MKNSMDVNWKQEKLNTCIFPGESGEWKEGTVVPYNEQELLNDTSTGNNSMETFKEKHKY